MKLDLLAFAAHPDDAELGCGGILNAHMLIGKKVGIVDLTKGEMGSRGTVELRSAESANASKILGLLCRENLEMEDGFIQNNKESQLKVIAAIRKYKPTIILINAPIDRHPDHGNAANLMVESAFKSGLAKIETIHNETGELQSAWRPKRVFHYIQDMLLEPSVIIDITNSFEAKMESVKAYRSQFFTEYGKGPSTYISNQIFLDDVEGRAKNMGKRIGVKYGEGLISVKNVNIGLNDLFIQILPAFT
jgi:N-acetylglucosamine malate deacetylase 1